MKIVFRLEQWNLLHLARALSKPRRPALLLSQPTRSMTERGEERLFQHLLEELDANQVVALTSTRAWSLQFADHAVLLGSDGRVLEERSVAEVKQISAELARQLSAAAAQARSQTMATYGADSDEATQYYQSLFAVSYGQLIEMFKAKSPLAVLLYRATQPRE